MHDHSNCSHELTALGTQIGIGEQAARAWVDLEQPIVKERGSLLADRWHMRKLA